MNQQIITESMLKAYGVKLGDQDIASLLQHLNDTLNERVGVEITDSLNDDQLDELLKLQESSDDEQVGEWIEQHVPELQEIIQDEVDILLGELAENADGLNRTI